MTQNFSKDKKNQFNMIVFLAQKKQVSTLLFSHNK